MKKIIMAFVCMLLVMAMSCNVQAGEREWATAGKILTGVVVAGALINAVTPSYTETVTYCPPPPPVYYRHPEIL